MPPANPETWAIALLFGFIYLILTQKQNTENFPYNKEMMKFTILVFN